MPLQPSDYDQLFVPGAAFPTSDGESRTVRLDSGWLSLPTGRVVAAEPGFLGLADEDCAFTQTVPPGKYPVGLAVVKYRDSEGAGVIDERVAAARLVIRDEPVVAWELAVVKGQDVAELDEAEFFGYAVDGGTGCFTDAGIIQSVLEDDPEWAIDVGMDVGDRPTAVNEAEGPDGEPILVAFSTGYGDGHYPTWIGRTAGGDVACFLTDFFLLDDEDAEAG
ncbi:DUF4241 domain-containing protein [Saccharopolyspora sp. NPDC050389]|uniref:DUF4241 domain-containing protein n=1 Tax=Saccharopolyspora sp. NPDC050389 TaxID=3155516 RepID=UPI0033D7220C